MLTKAWIEAKEINDAPAARAFGLIELNPNSPININLTDKGRDFFSWYLLNHE